LWSEEYRMNSHKQDHDMKQGDHGRMMEEEQSKMLWAHISGAWILIAPWLLCGVTATAKWNDVITGVALVLFSLPRGRVKERYGGWQPYIV